jgi:transposase
LQQLKEVGDDKQQEHLDLIYQRLAEIQANFFITSIESIHTPDSLVTDKEFIREWLANTIQENYSKIKTKLEENRLEWSIPKLPIKCTSCGHEASLEVTMDQSNFFS